MNLFVRAGDHPSDFLFVKFFPLPLTSSLSSSILFLLETSMRTKLLLSLLGFIAFTFFLLPASFAQTPPSSSGTGVTQVQYDLLYPGILPDNWLYKVKVFRDKIIEQFITDPNQKVLFYLRQADKGILATAMLLDKNETDLANTTALKAENNMTLITKYLSSVDWNKNPELLTKIKTASLKHGEVLGVLINRLPAASQQTLRTVLEFSQRNLQTVQQFETESR